MIIGDVRGKGLDAVRLASIVLGSYRHVAYERADLRAVVADLDRAVARNVGDEDFVTAALVEERGGTLTIVNCGHPPPLLLRRGAVIPLEPPAPAPPLGFMPVVRPRVERLEPGDRLLLFTDGLGEARRDGEFFPTADRAWRLLGHGTVADGLASLETALVEWVHGRLDDDIALVLMEYAGPHRGVTVSGARAGRSAPPRADSVSAARQVCNRRHFGDPLVAAYPRVIQCGLLIGNTCPEAGPASMTHYKSNLRDLEFNLFEVFGADQAFGQGRTRNSTSTPPARFLAELDRLAREDLAASYTDSDRNPPVFDPATHTAPLPASFKKSYQAFMDSEFWRLDLPPHLGGTNAPRALWWALAELVLGSNAPDLDVRLRPVVRARPGGRGHRAAEAVGQALHRQAVGLHDGAHRAGRRLGRRRRPRPRDPAARRLLAHRGRQALHHLG